MSKDSISDLTGSLTAGPTGIDEVAARLVGRVIQDGDLEGCRMVFAPAAFPLSGRIWTVRVTSRKMTRKERGMQ